MKKNLFFTLTLILFGMLLTACSSTPSATPTGNTRPLLPTANVPPLTDVDTAIQRWQQSNNTSYYLKIDEQTAQSLRRLHIVVADGKIRAALVQLRSEGQWGELTSLPFTEARNYTVDELLARVRRDTLGAGEAPVNLKVVFDKSMGLPMVIQAEGLPAYAPDGTVKLNREYGYSIVTEIAPLLEESANNQSGIWLELSQGNGPQARCDHLFIFQDGSSLYTDDCRQTSLPLQLPAARQEELANFSATFATLSANQSDAQQVRTLTLQGSGNVPPDEETIQAAWALAERFYDLLSYPLGAGVTLIFSQQDEVLGAEMLRQTIQPARIAIHSPLYGAQVDTQGQFLALSDANGLQALDPNTGEKQPLLIAPQDGSYYLPRAWNVNGQLLISQVWPDGSRRLGWIRREGKGWQDLPPLPDGSPFTCDDGAVWSPDGTQLAVSSSHADCASFRGLAVVDLKAKKTVLLPGIPAASHVAWSTDGAWLAFSMADESGAQRVYVVHPDGSGLAPVSDNATGTADYPVWGLDGTLYYALQVPQQEVSGLYAYNTTANQHNLLIPDTDVQPVSLSPDGEFLLYRLGDKQYVWSFLREENMDVILKQNAKLAGWLVPPEGK